VVAYAPLGSTSRQVGLTLELAETGLVIAAQTLLAAGTRISGELNLPDGSGRVTFSGVVRSSRSGEMVVMFQQPPVSESTYRALLADVGGRGRTSVPPREPPLPTSTAVPTETQKVFGASAPPSRAPREVITAEIDAAAEMARARAIPANPRTATDPWRPSMAPASPPEAQRAVATAGASPLEIDIDVSDAGAEDEAVAEWTRKDGSLHLLPSDLGLPPLPKTGPPAPSGPAQAAQPPTGTPPPVADAVGPAQSGEADDDFDALFDRIREE